MDDTVEVFAFLVTVAGGHASISDYREPFAPPVAEARAATNDGAVAAAFNLITIPEGESE